METCGVDEAKSKENIFLTLSMLEISDSSSFSLSMVSVLAARGSASALLLTKPTPICARTLKAELVPCAPLPTMRDSRVSISDRVVEPNSVASSRGLPVLASVSRCRFRKLRTEL